MALELVKYINSDLTWSAVKRGRRTMRYPKNKNQESVVLDYEKSGVAVLGQRFAEEVLDVPIKKRILLRRHQKLSSHDDELNNGLSNGENLMQIEKKVLDRNDFSGIELLADAACVESPAVEGKVPKADGVKDDIAPMDSDKSSLQNLSDNGNCEVDKSSVPSKNLRLHWDLNTVMDDWEEEPCCDILVDPHSEKSYSKDSFNEGLTNDKASHVAEDEKRIILDDTIISVVPLNKPEISVIQEKNDGDTMEEVNEITCKKTSEMDSGLSKSDLVELFVHPAKSENVSAITPSVIEVQILNKCDDGQAVSEVVQGGYLSLKGDGDDKLTSEDHLSDCCGSNDSEDEPGQIVEGSAIDKVISGYDSPVEDGELREPTGYPWEKIELEERECVDYESDDNMYEDNFDTIESAKNEITLDEHQKSVGVLGAVPNNHIEQSAKVGTSNRRDHREYSQSAMLEEKNASSAKLLSERRSVRDVFPDRTTSVGRRNGDSIRRSRSDNFGYSYLRVNRDFGPKEFMGRDGPSYHGHAPNDATGRWVDSNSRGYPRPKNDQSLNYKSRVNYRTFNTRQLPSDRNESYGVHRGEPQARGISRDSRGASGLHLQGLRRPPQEEYNDPEPCYSERKGPYFSSSFNRGADHSRSRKRSRSRSRSVSPPIAWNFQKKLHTDTQKQSPERFPYQKLNSSGENDRNIINEQYKDRRTSPVRTFHREQRFNNFQPNSRPARFPQATGPIREKFEVNSVEKYGMMNGGRNYRYDVDPRNKDNGFRYVCKDNRCFRDLIERDIPQNRSDVKGCRYTTNKIFNTAEGDFHKNNLQRE